jgi:hypothetical protein
VTHGVGDGPDGAVGATEAGRDVELDGVNTQVVAANSAQAQGKIAGQVVILVFPVGRGRFSASSDGGVLVETSSTPLLDAARVLAGEGGDPATRIMMRHQGKDYDALTSTVGIAAGLDVKGDHFVKHRPRVEGVETADQTVAHTSKPVGGVLDPIPSPPARQEVLLAVSPLLKPSSERGTAHHDRRDHQHSRPFFCRKGRRDPHAVLEIGKHLTEAKGESP